MSISSIIKISLYILVAISFVSCMSYSSSMHSRGDIGTKSISVATFKAIDIESGSYDVVVNFSQTQDIKISTYEHIIPLVYFVVEGYTLNIASSPLYSIDSRVKISISVSALEKISIDDGASVNLSMTRIGGQLFVIEADGFLDATLSGNINYLGIDAGGLSRINATNLISKNVNVKVGGRSNVVVRAIDALQVDIDGMGSVKYHGTPVRFSKKIEGLGSIEKL